MALGFTVIFWALGLFILYIVITKAVRDGINQSLIGQFIQEKSGVKEDKKPFLNNDLDKD